jgi:serine/threonine protein kinase
VESVKDILPFFGVQIGQVIGKGAFASVFKAVEISSGRKVALKVVKPKENLDQEDEATQAKTDEVYQGVLQTMKEEAAHVQVCEIEKPSAV